MNTKLYKRIETLESSTGKNTDIPPAAWIAPTDSEAQQIRELDLQPIKWTSSEPDETK